MKTLLQVIIIAVVALAILLGFRYALVVDSPIVAKIDRITGDVWIASAGTWRKVQPQEEIQTAGAKSNTGTQAPSKTR
jgi:hypothetical protein